MQPYSGATITRGGGGGGAAAADGLASSPLKPAPGSMAMEAAVARASYEAATAAAGAAADLRRITLSGGFTVQQMDSGTPNSLRAAAAAASEAIAASAPGGSGSQQQQQRSRRPAPAGGAGGGAQGQGGSPTADALFDAWRANEHLATASSGDPLERCGSPAGTLSAAGGSGTVRRRCPFLIGVAGGTASGKTTVCDRIVQRLHEQCVVMINQDSFYRDLTQDDLARLPDYNFDHPDAFDTPLMLSCIQDLRSGRPTEMPQYDFTAHKRGKDTRTLDPADVIIVEGILVLHMPEIRDQLHMKIYVDTDDDVRLARRIQRDVQHRGRDVAGVIEQYTKFVKPAFDQFVAPSRRYADVIIPWQRGDNLVAIDLITEHIRLKLQQHDLLRIYPNLEVMPSNFQIRGMHTIIRDRSTSMSDFTFYADRLNRLVVEAGLGHLPFVEKTVVTPTGHRYVGVEFCRGLCGVSVIRSGESMETALRECCQGIKLGKILVHRHGVGVSQEEVVYARLPADISRRYVMLLDPVLGTGHTACRAVQILLDRGVAEDHILFLCIIASPEAVHMVCTTFPQIKVITSEIDRSLDDQYRVVPGVGEWGNRYFSD